MAQFQKGSPTSLERHLGIVYGFIGAEDFDSVYILTLADGKDAIVHMVTEGVITPEKGEMIYQSMEEAGVCPDMQTVISKATSTTLPDDFYPTWTLRWEKCDECDIDHGTLVNKNLEVEASPEIEDFLSAFATCDGLFQDEMMSLEEAIYILKEVVEKVPLETKKDEEPSNPN